jgi:hypothetical protein
MRVIGVTLLVTLAFVPRAYSEIEKVATLCEKRFCFYTWPMLPQIDGWKQDRDQSLALGVNALAAIGTSFANADAVMYAKAVYKPQVPSATSLELFIEYDRTGFTQGGSGAEAAEAPSLTTADGRLLKSLTFFPTGKSGNWERVSYGEEGNYYLIFTLSSRTLKAYEEALPDYELLIARYKEKP